jgi:hypothetical protein
MSNPINIVMIVFKIACNDRACCCAGILYRSAHNVSPIEKLKIKIVQKLNYESPARTEADSIKIAEDMQVSQHNSKPLVVGPGIYSVHIK